MAQSTEQALMLRLEASLRTFERQMERARGVGRQTARGIQGDFDGMNRQLAASSQRGAQALQGVMNVSRQGRFVLQNTAANIGDIAVQLEQGTNVFRVAGQQLPQVFGGFAALGGSLGLVMPLLATLVAIGAPVAAFLFQTRGGSEEAARGVDQLVSALDDFNRAADFALTDISRLREDYGSLADEVLAAARAAAQAALQLSLIELDGGIAEIFDSTPAIEAAQAAALQRAEVNDLLRRSVQGENVSSALREAQYMLQIMEQGAQRTAAALGILPDQAEALGNALARVRNANGIEAIASAAFQAIQRIEEMRQATGSLSPEMSRVLVTLEGIARRAAEAAAKSDDLERAGRGAAGAFSTAGSAADSLNNVLRSGVALSAQLLANISSIPGAMSALAGAVGDQIEGLASQNRALEIELGTGVAAAVAQRQVQLEQLIEQARANGSRVNVDQIADLQIEINELQALTERQEALRQQIADRNRPASGSGRSGAGGGGGAEEVAPHLQALASLLREVQRESVTLEQVQAALTAEYEAGEIGIEDYSRAMELARERFSETNREAQQLGAVLADMALNWDEAGDIAVNALRRIARELLSSAFTQAIQRLMSVSGGGSGGGGFLSLVLGAFGGKRESGGPVQAGKTYLVGEKGPELVRFGSSGTVIPNHELASSVPPFRGAALSGGASGTITLRIEEAPGFASRVRAEAQGVAIQTTRAGIEAYNRGLPDRVAEIQRDPRRVG